MQSTLSKELYLLAGLRMSQCTDYKENVDSCICVSDIHVCLGLFVKSGRAHTFQLVLQVRAFAAKLAGIQSV